ncbi:RNA pyrophosphohydrolase [Oricola cellulosilytica]|uniref:RNA pyrophosphohydrolase n=1 Tax=Oricola cellulosilytica TaxID=1429082 RepID=A0A4R0P9F4_9HYPH|nr:RNA pyrophosphohydrolase [Oricola cellulosilytica]TCD13799.1 RNA pyrophosphohydrolase [Oricola cellulosilytica]
MSDTKKCRPNDLPYRPCVGIMVLNADGLVWAGKRAKEGNTEYSGHAKLWQLPQGGIDKGEDPLSAAYRELYEETGMRSVDLIGEAPEWMDYDLPEHLIGTGLKGKYCGQTQKWFAFRFTGDDSEVRIDPPPDGHEREFEEWAWLPMAELPDLIVPFKRAVYEELVRVFGHLAGNSPQ